MLIKSPCGAVNPRRNEDIMDKNDMKLKIKSWKNCQDKITFISLMRDLCNSNGCYADYPKDTKKFWHDFALQCIDNDLIERTDGLL